MSPERSVKLPESGSEGKFADMDSSLAVIVTHPWGPLGGNMNNNVVLGVTLWFQKLNISTLRFDFCGHQIGRGYPQVQQVQEAATAVLKGVFSAKRKTKHHHQRPPTRILLVGYSYGSIIAASAASSIPEVIGVMSVAPPLGVRHWLFLFHGNYHLDQMRQRRNLPQLMVLGDNDNFTSEESFLRVVQTMPQESTTGAVLKGADHFFRGREKDLMDILGHWIVSVFPQCNGDLKALRNADFPVYEVALMDQQTMSGLSTKIMNDNDPGCHVCVPLVPR